MKFSERLIKWYLQNKRDLPWRDTRDAYAIYLSEVILQQTRVDQGMSYYLKFISAYKTVNDLACAQEEDVLKLWQGLGYYSRARNLHQTAKQVVQIHGGVFPASYEQLLDLKGIGPYTAAALSSFAFNLPHAAIDGNVYRVLSRFFGIETAIDSSAGKKEFASLANELLDRKQPGLFNQAMMELGALVCKPKSPDCSFCPFISECKANKLQIIDLLPVKEKKIKVKERAFNYLVVCSHQEMLVKLRSGKDIWKGLYDFPMVESKKILTRQQLLQLIKKNNMLQGEPLELTAEVGPMRHLLTHQKITATFFIFNCDLQPGIEKDWMWVPLKKIGTLPVPRLIENFLNTHFY